jgi:hypothetical protein
MFNKFDWWIIEKYCKEIGLIQKDWMLVSVWYPSEKLIDIRFLPKYENIVTTTDYQIETGDLESWIRDKKIQDILN